MDPNNIGNVHNTTVKIYDRLPFIKVAVLSSLLFASSFWLGFELNVLAYVPHGIEVFKIIPFSLALVSFLILADICIILISDRSIIYSISSISSLFIFFGFLNNISVRLAIAIIVFLLFFLLAVYYGRRFIEASLKIRFIAVSNVILSKIIIGIALFGALIVFNVFSFVPVHQNDFIISKSMFETTSNKFSDIIAPVSGGVDFSKSLRQIATESVVKTIKDQGLDPNNINIEKFVSQSLSQYQIKIEEVFKNKINPDEKLSSAIYEVLLSSFNNLDKPIKQLVLAGISFILFLSIVSFSPLIKIIAGVFALILYKILYLFGFFVITNSVKEAENIVIT